MLIKKISEFFRSKKILTSVSLYAAGFWLIIRVLVTMSPYLHIPPYWVNVTLYTGILLLPLFLFHLFVIHYDPQSENKIINKLYLLSEEIELRVWPKIILVLASALLSFLFTGGDVSPSKRLPAIGDSSDNKLAVTYFQNQTGNPELDVLGPMITHWLTEGFIQNGIVQIASVNSVREVYASNESSSIGNVVDFQNLLGTKYTIDGAYFLQGDSITLTSNLIDSYTGSIVHSFGAFQGSKDKPLDLIEALRQKSLGYWFSRDKIDRYPPPKFDAYKNYIEAQKRWSEDDDLVKELLEESRQLDPSFHEPIFLLIALARNTRQWESCDSLLNYISTKKSSLTKSQLSKFNFFKNELGGDYNNAIKFLIEEYEFDKSDVFMNTSVMHFANYRLNDPNLCNTVAHDIDNQQLDFDNCKYCKSRLYNHARAHYQLGLHAKVRALHSFNTKVNNDQRLEEVFLLSAAEERNTTVVDSIMTTISESGDKIRFLEQGLALVTKLINIGEKTSAADWMNQLGIQIKGSKSQDAIFFELKSKWHELNGDLVLAKNIYNQLFDSYDDDFYQWRIYGVKAQEGNFQEVINFINDQLQDVAKFDFGYKHYEAARLYSLLGDTELALSHLQKSINGGRQFHISFFDQDWYLRSIWDSEKYTELLHSRRVSF